MDTNILLENGTNEVEILEFTLEDGHYGINVAKTMEILPFCNVTPIPNSHPCIEGIFVLRDTIISVINLRKSLSLSCGNESGMFVITNLNKLNIAFHVDAVLGINRVSWADIIKPDQITDDIQECSITGIVQIDERKITILDFEKIVSDINPETGN